MSAFLRQQCRTVRAEAPSDLATFEARPHNDREGTSYDTSVHVYCTAELRFCLRFSHLAVLAVFQIPNIHPSASYGMRTENAGIAASSRTYHLRSSHLALFRRPTATRVRHMMLLVGVYCSVRLRLATCKLLLERASSSTGTFFHGT